MSMALTNREMGTQIPISIPTAVPLEMLLFDEGTEQGDIWINVRTLVRNCLNTLSTEEKMDVKDSDVATEILTEIETIENVVEMASGGNRRTVFYVTEKKSFQRVFPKALPKGYITPKQKMELTMTNNILYEVVGARPDKIKVFDIKLGESNRPVLLLTHQPIDLLSEYSFKSCKLLESHTGKIKSKAYWYTKLSGKDKDNMPFNALTLQIFGDNESFAAYPRKLKLELIELSRERKWTPITSKTKVEADLDKLVDRHGAELLKGMLRARP